jgi:exodeoxyribonuclease VII large subunit
MQGNLVASELPRALTAIAKKADQFDAIVIIRGGGARLDLSAFDGLEVCKAVANAPLPVLTGIGHDVDETLMDLTAHSALKTPTAVADFLVQHNVVFESQMLYLGDFIQKHTQQIVQYQNSVLDNAAQIIRWSANALLKEQQQNLQYLENQIAPLTQRNLQQQYRLLASFEHICKAIDPQTTLKRGFTQTYNNGTLVTSSKDLTKGNVIETLFFDGKMESLVS